MHVPWRLRQPLVRSCCCGSRSARPSATGCPRPERGLFQDHPTITDTVLSRISHGEIAPKPGIDALRRRRVRFVDGTPRTVDAIVWCTGYRVAMPFLDQALVGPDPRELPLYKRVFHLDARRPVLHRADAVHRVGVPDRRAPGAAAGRAPDRALGAAVAARRCAPSASAGAGARSSAGARTAARRCAWTSTATCTSSGDASSSAGRAAGGRNGGAREPARARHRRAAARSAPRCARSCASAAGGWPGSTCAPTRATPRCSRAT